VISKSIDSEGWSRSQEKTSQRVLLPLQRQVDGVAELVTKIPFDGFGLSQRLRVLAGNLSRQLRNARIDSRQGQVFFSKLFGKHLHGPAGQGFHGWWNPALHLIAQRFSESPPHEKRSCVIG
jgi:hypothetical protein